MNKIVLIDMDGVIVDFERGFIESWRKKYPNKPYISLKERKNFYVIDDYPEELKRDASKIYLEIGFFEKLKPIKDAIPAFKEISRKFEVFIITSPLTERPNTISEKMEWIKKKLGNETLERLIITKDKTIVHADYLIDDKPGVQGIFTPTWEQIIFDQPYNQNVKGKKRTNWRNWKEILR